MSEELNENTQAPNVEVEAKATRTRSTAPTKVKEVITPEVVSTRSQIMTAQEYAEYSKRNGTFNGRKANEKTQLTVEEFVVLSRDNWTPKMMMEKHGITLEELQAVASRVPLIMQLNRPIQVTATSIKW
jgi:hypothetical protein